ncbi:MAG: homogentisate 1,2-dioxygenase [Bacteroidota bacterium]
MPHYTRLGEVPPKRHTQFRKPNGELYAEELFSTEGFSAEYSNIYHLYPPTLVKHAGTPVDITPNIVDRHNIRHRCYRGFQIKPTDDFIESRQVVLTNSDVQIALAAPRQSMKDYFYKNAVADECVFIHKGSGTLHTGFGKLEFKKGDYVVIPRGVVHQYEFEDDDNRLLITESFSHIRFPKKYLSKRGQLLEHSPFCERDIHPPQALETIDAHGDFTVKIKKYHTLTDYVYSTHPFDFVGWDGCAYPYTTSIYDFEPITGRIHQPPPVHQHFEAHNFVICSFVPRLFDYHPESIPAPYNHSNVDSDEVLYYVDGDFMSRKHVEQGMITLHPMGIPHGPHPGTVEKSIGAKDTEEYAVMIDTFRPLHLTDVATGIEMEDYWKSWQA